MKIFDQKLVARSVPDFMADAVKGYLETSHPSIAFEVVLRAGTTWFVADGSTLALIGAFIQGHWAGEAYQVRLAQEPRRFVSNYCHWGRGVGDASDA